MSAVELPAARLVPEVIPGPAGNLEALLRIPPEPMGASVVAHPHPLHGGTMHTKVVHRAGRLLSDRFGLLSLRFNFRGVGASVGRHDDGRGEVDDLVAAARWLRQRQPSGPLVVGGFSFGAMCALRAAASLGPDVLLIIGFPITLWPRRELPNTSGARVVWVQGDRDAFGAVERARQFAERQNWRLAVVSNADHFFTDRLEAFEDTVAAELAKVLGPA